MLLFSCYFSDHCSLGKKEKDRIRKLNQRANLCLELVEKTKIYDRKRAAKRRLYLKAEAAKYDTCIKKVQMEKFVLQEHLLSLLIALLTQA